MFVSLSINIMLGSLSISHFVCICIIILYLKSSFSTQSSSMSTSLKIITRLQFFTSNMLLHLMLETKLTLRDDSQNNVVLLQTCWTFYGINNVNTYSHSSWDSFFFLRPLLMFLHCLLDMRQSQPHVSSSCKNGFGHRYLQLHLQSE